MVKWLLLHLISWWKAPPPGSNGDNPLDQEPTGHVDEAAYERHLLGHLLDALKTMLP
jgi:hypothetical protein